MENFASIALGHSTHVQQISGTTHFVDTFALFAPLIADTLESVCKFIRTSESSRYPLGESAFQAGKGQLLRDR